MPKPASHITDEVIRSKILRIARGEMPRLVDLFAGCGGLSLGFKRAGFEIKGALEIDSLAARSHAENLFRAESPNAREIHARPRDITRLEPEELIEDLAIGEPSRAVDILVGGPPCQAY